MKPSEACYNLIMSFESYRANPYLDTSNVWTIGWGSTRDASGNPVKQNTPSVTLAQATALMDRDIDQVFSQLTTALVGAKTALNQNQKDALGSLVYNIGIGDFEKSNLLKNLKAGIAVIEDNFVSWDESGGVVSQGLINRRKAEWALYVRNGLELLSISTLKLI